MCRQSSTATPIGKKSSHRTAQTTVQFAWFVQHVELQANYGVIKVSNNRFGFVAGCGTTDAIWPSFREALRETEAGRIAFLYLKKLFDRVPREMMVRPGYT